MQQLSALQQTSTGHDASTVPQTCAASITTELPSAARAACTAPQASIAQQTSTGHNASTVPHTCAALITTELPSAACACHLANASPAAVVSSATLVRCCRCEHAKLTRAAQIASPSSRFQLDVAGSLLREPIRVTSFDFMFDCTEQCHSPSPPSLTLVATCSRRRLPSFIFALIARAFVLPSSLHLSLLLRTHLQPDDGVRDPGGVSPFLVCSHPDCRCDRLLLNLLFCGANGFPQPALGSNSVLIGFLIGV